MTYSVTILGCGFSGGVPRPGAGWGHCDPNNLKNRRRRCSILVERTAPGGGKTRVLVDTGPDLREQLLSADVNYLDGVLYTHEHADHIHGIDDLRGLYLANHKKVDVYADEPTWRTLSLRFGYCFVTPPGSGYPAILNRHPLDDREPVTIPGAGGGVTALPVLLNHGDIDALGFRFGGMAYSPDVADIPAASAAALEGIELWIIDGLWHRGRHRSHFNVEQALQWIGRLKPKRAIITNMHSDLDYEKLRAELPPNVVPAYDGMRIEFDGGA